MIAFIVITGLFLLICWQYNKPKKEKKPRNPLLCPICKQHLTVYNASRTTWCPKGTLKATYICKDCDMKLSRLKNKTGHADAYLEELQEMVKEYDLKHGIKSNQDNTSYNTNYTSYRNDWEKELELENQYRDVLDKHYKYLEQEDMLYSTAINLPNIDNKATNKCIDICLKDIELAEAFKEYELKYQKLNDLNDGLPRYPAFYYLTQLYTKLDKIDEAIMICKRAIDLGYNRDNSKGGMPGRLARLIKKKDKESKEKMYEENIL